MAENPGNNGRIDDNRSLIDSLVNWWEIAGVADAVQEQGRDWSSEIVPVLAQPDEAVPARPPVTSGDAPRPRKTATPEAPARQHDVMASMPGDLDAFRGWWMGDPALNAPYANGPRIAPSGTSGAKFMLVADMPEQDDRDMLMSGRAGRLLDRMLGAAGLARDSVYVASLLPWRALDAHPVRANLALWMTVLERHIQLAAPQKLIILGQNDIMARVRNNLPQNAKNLLFVNHASGQIEPLASHHPRTMLTNPALKAANWTDWRALAREAMG
ncbi:MAG: uracil-DNA glycosylase family protein [Blastomonas sp.]